MSSKRTLAVFGATGNQGGSVVKAILNDPKTADQFEIRAITRDPSRPAALALVEKGVTLVKADLNDKDSLRLALTGAYAVFAITDWQSILDKEKEIQLGKNAADIARELNIQHFIYSSLPDVTKISGGKFTKVYHFDGKAIVENYIRELGIPATFFTPGIFNPFVLGLLQPISPGSKTYVMALPADPTNPKGIFPLIDIKEDAGNYVKAILLHREKVLGKQVVAAAKYYSIAEILRILKEVGGLDVVFQQISDEAFTAGMVQAGVPEFFAEDIAENFKFMQEFGYYGGASLSLDQALLDKPPVTFEDWITSSKAIAALK